MPRPEDIVVGIGLSGTATAEGAAAFLNQVLTSAKIDRARIRALATIDRRADNAILAQLAVELGVPARTFSAERLERRRRGSGTPRRASLPGSAATAWRKPQRWRKRARLHG